jgi:drug/metabolite transporter (DMT)-like permease
VAKKYHEAGKANGTALFFLIVAVIAAGVRFAAHEHSMPSATVMMPVLYAGLVPAGIGYLLWEIGMKRGDITLLASASYLLALTSTLFTCWYLHVALGANLLIGALLTVVGALLTNRGVRVVQKV